MDPMHFLNKKMYLFSYFLLIILLKRCKISHQVSKSVSEKLKIHTFN